MSIYAEIAENVRTFTRTTITDARIVECQRKWINKWFWIRAYEDNIEEEEKKKNVRCLNWTPLRDRLSRNILITIYRGWGQKKKKQKKNTIQNDLAELCHENQNERSQFFGLFIFFSYAFYLYNLIWE